MSHWPAAVVEGRGQCSEHRGGHETWGPRSDHQQLQHYLILGLQGLTSDPPSFFAKWTELCVHSKERQVRGKCTNINYSLPAYFFIINNMINQEYESNCKSKKQWYVYIYAISMLMYFCHEHSELQLLPDRFHKYIFLSNVICQGFCCQLPFVELM